MGGPSQYAKEIADEFKRQGHQVKVLTYKFERKLPTLVRHELFFWRTFFTIIFWRPSFVIALDTFSVGWPSVMAARLLGKKILIRTGGDFLWESYVERTGDLVMFRNFYDTRRGKFSLKEKIIFGLTQWTLQNASAVIFSTAWQRQIFEPAYDLNPAKSFIIENFYGEKLPSIKPDSQNQKKVFVAGTRPLNRGRTLKWKNISRLKEAFDLAKQDAKGIELVLDLDSAPYNEFIEKIRKSYAVILTSLGDISPNMILDAIRARKPFILTKETGLYEKLKEVAIFVDPENPEDIKEKILFLAAEKNYDAQKSKVESFSFFHSWSDICREFVDVAEKNT